MNTLENLLIRALNNAADQHAPDAGLVDRLLTSTHDDLAVPRRSLSPRRRTTTLLMAAAVAVIVVAGVLIGSRFAAQRPSPITPPVTPSPSPTVVSSSEGSPTSPSASVPSPSSGGNLPATESFITARTSTSGAPAGFTVDSVSFRSADEGMALGTARCPSAAAGSDTTRCGVLVGTTDGGLNWTLITLPDGADVPGSAPCPSYTDGSQCTSRINVADPAAGYLWGPKQIFRTTDGGRSWQQLSVGSADVAQLVSVQGRAFVAAVPAGSLDWEQATLQEVGSGDTAFTNSTASGGAAFGPAELIQGPGIVYRWLSASEGARVQSSTNGRSWSDLPEPATKGITIFAAGDGSLVSDGSDTDAVGQVLPVGGTSWQKIPQPPVPAGGSAGTASFSLAGAVSAREIAVIISGFDFDAAGGQAWITTADGGRIWDSPLRSTGEAAARGVQAGQVTAGSDLIVPWSLGSALLRSGDGGRTWTQYDFPRG